MTKKDNRRSGETLKSTCCNAKLNKCLMTPIDTGYTMFCSMCGERDRKAERKASESKVT